MSNQSNQQSNQSNLEENKQQQQGNSLTTPSYQDEVTVYTTKYKRPRPAKQTFTKRNKAYKAAYNDFTKKVPEEQRTYKNLSDSWDKNTDTGIALTDFVNAVTPVFRGRKAVNDIERMVGIKMMNKLQPNFDSMSTKDKIAYMEVCLADDLPMLQLLRSGVTALASKYGGQALSSILTWLKNKWNEKTGDQWDQAPNQNQMSKQPMQSTTDQVMYTKYASKFSQVNISALRTIFTGKGPLIRWPGCYVPTAINAFTQQVVYTMVQYPPYNFSIKFYPDAGNIGGGIIGSVTSTNSASAYSPSTDTGGTVGSITSAFSATLYSAYRCISFVFTVDVTTSSMNNEGKIEVVTNGAAQWPMNTSNGITRQSLQVSPTYTVSAVSKNQTIGGAIPINLSTVTNITANSPTSNNTYPTSYFEVRGEGLDATASITVTARMVVMYIPSQTNYIDQVSYPEPSIATTQLYQEILANRQDMFTNLPNQNEQILKCVENATTYEEAIQCLSEAKHDGTNNSGYLQSGAIATNSMAVAKEETKTVTAEHPHRIQLRSAIAKRKIVPIPLKKTAVVDAIQIKDLNIFNYADMANLVCGPNKEWYMENGNYYYLSTDEIHEAIKRKLITSRHVDWTTAKKMLKLDFDIRDEFYLPTYLEYLKNFKIESEEPTLEELTDVEVLHQTGRIKKILSKDKLDITKLPGTPLERLNDYSNILDYLEDEIEMNADLAVAISNIV